MRKRLIMVEYQSDQKNEEDEEAIRKRLESQAKDGVKNLKVVSSVTVRIRKDK